MPGVKGQSQARSAQRQAVRGMFGALTSVLARECRSVVNGRMAGAVFAGKSNRFLLVAEVRGGRICTRSHPVCTLSPQGYPSAFSYP